MEYERKTGIKADSQVLGLSNWEAGVALAETEKHVKGASAG